MLDTVHVLPSQPILAMCEQFTRFATIAVAITGYGFVDASKHIFQTLKRNFLQTYNLWWVLVGQPLAAQCHPVLCVYIHIGHSIYIIYTNMLDIMVSHHTLPVWQMHTQCHLMPWHTLTLFHFIVIHIVLQGTMLWFCITAMLSNATCLLPLFTAYESGMCA